MKSANKMQIPLTIYGFHSQFADSTYNLRIRLTIADSGTAQFNDRNVLSFVCGFHKLFWIPQIQLRIQQIGLFLEQFWAVQWFRYNVADFATNLILTCCGFRLQCRECTVWPRTENAWTINAVKQRKTRRIDREKLTQLRIDYKLINKIFGLTLVWPSKRQVLAANFRSLPLKLRTNDITYCWYKSFVPKH